MDTLHIGIIGAGIIAEQHARSMMEQPRVGEVSIYDVEEARAEELAESTGGRALASEEALLQECDVVWICTPPVFHPEGVERACAEGKAVFCEKPLAINQEGLRRIERAVEQAGVPFFMGQSARWSDPFRKMRARALDGTIGELVHVASTRMGWLDRAVHPDWRLDDARSGGVVVELGVHEIDFILWVGGKWSEVEASGSGRIIAPGRFLDSVHATGLLSSGATALLDLSWGEPRYLWERMVRGTDGSMLCNDARFTRVELWRPGKQEPEIIEADDWKHPETGENMALREQLAAAVASLLDGEPFPVSLADGAEAVRTALDIRAAAKKTMATGP